MEPPRNRVDGHARECFALARARKWEECAVLARRWLEVEPLNVDATLYLLNALKAPSTAAAYQAALDEYALLERKLHQELGSEPADDIVRLAASIRANLTATPEPQSIPAPRRGPDPTPRSTDGARPLTGLGRFRRGAGSGMVSLPFAAALLIGATSLTARHPASQLPVDVSARPSVAVADVRNLAGDSATAWLELGLPEMVMSDIARLPGVRVVSPERVREARQALNLPRGSVLTRDDLRRLGAASGAQWIASGGITRGDNLYVLDLSLHDAAGKREPRLFTVASPSLVALADEAATRLAVLASR